MKKQIMLMCALLISVFTLSGAANRSFRTEVEQWNPIGFTQAQSGNQITRTPRMGSALLSGLTTNEPTGTMRGGGDNVITFTTAKKAGETVELYMEYTGAAPTLTGLNGVLVNKSSITYTLSSQTVTIRGNVTKFISTDNQLYSLDVSQNTALEYLDCTKNRLKDLDVSKNTALTYLDCGENKLTTLNVSKNTALTVLGCYTNQLTELDISKNTALTWLFCEGNKLTALNVSKHTALTAFSCSYNPLKVLDVSKNTALEALGCSGIQLKTLDLSKLTALKGLDCANNKLTALDLTHNTALTRLDCSNNQLDVFDLSKNTALTELNCSGMQLNTLDLSKHTALTKLTCNNNQLNVLDLSQNTALTRLECTGNKLAALDLSQNTALTWLECYNNQLTALDLSKNTALMDLSCYGNQIKGKEMSRLVNSLPDRTDKIAGTFVVEQEPNPEGNLCLKTDVAVAKGKNWNARLLHNLTDFPGDYQGKELSISFKSAKATFEKITLKMEYTGRAPRLLGLDGTPINGKFVTYTYTYTSEEVKIIGDVTTLDCRDNQLTELDLSRNNALTYLNCSGNQLTTLDVSTNPALTELECSTNQLTTLDLSENTALTKLWCGENELTTLDVSHNTALTLLCCGNNQLSALDVSQNDELTWLNCYNNQIKGEEMTRLVNSLPDRTDKPAGTFLVILEQGSEGNRCLKKDVAIAKGKNWNVYKAISDDGPDDPVPYEGEEPIFYAVTLARIGEGTLTATGADNLDAVPEGTELTVVATPAAGYELTALTANGRDILATKKFTVTAATEVKATFTKKNYAVTLTKEGEGKLTATGAADLAAVTYGTELTIVAAPAAGYELKALTANGKDILATQKVVVTSDTEVKATFAKKTAADVVEAGTLCLYPNPAGTYVNVRATKANALVRLYDANGSLRYEARTDADGTLQIDLSAYAEGTYLLRVDNDAQRLLIQR